MEPWLRLPPVSLYNRSYMGLRLSLVSLMALEVNKHHVKVQYDKSVHPRKFSEGDLVLSWDQAKEPLGAGNFKPMWHGPYVVIFSLDIP